MSFMIAAAAVSVVSQVAAGNSAAKGANSQSVEGNEAIIKSNIANTIRTGYRVGLANMQRGLSKKQAVQQGFNITKAGASALGEATANAAASGTVGASIDAVSNDIKMKIGEAQAENQEQADVDLANFKTQIEGISFEGENSLQESIKSKAQSSSSIWGGALLSGAAGLASSYFSAKAKLGVGDVSVNPNGSTAAGLKAGGFGVGTGFNNANWGKR